MYKLLISLLESPKISNEKKYYPKTSETMCLDTLSYISGTLRIILMLCQAFFFISSYLFILYVPLLPVLCICPKFFYKIENILYYNLLYSVSSWSWLQRMYVYEHGDEIDKLLEDPNAKVLLIANHQSTADVPFMMQALMNHPNYKLMWIMDKAFHYTPFGIVAAQHGDYFLDCYNYIPGSLRKHTEKQVECGKNLVILFPEGGFRFKKVDSSTRYALKNQLPELRNVVYPRFMGYNELLGSATDFTHVVDLTICYDGRERSPGAADIFFGYYPSEVNFHYKTYDVKTTPNINTIDWLNQRWFEKDRLLSQHYQYMNNELGPPPETVTNSRRVELSFTRIAFINLFFTTICALLCSGFYILLLSFFN